MSVFFTTREPIWTHFHYLKSTVYLKTHSFCCAVLQVWTNTNVLNPALQCHSITALKMLCAPPVQPTFLSPKPLQPQVYSCSYRCASACVCVVKYAHHGICNSNHFECTGQWAWIRSQCSTTIAIINLSIALPFPEGRVVEMTQYEAFSDWLLSQMRVYVSTFSWLISFISA